ncbi:MAG TPA: IS4 family transposase [Planctomycetota bacterium]|nr:IS4 family transposase [Planctomycetota bacterium]HUV38679.1 IS4 family transposase [Planctomycetota bacterium]
MHTGRLVFAQLLDFLPRRDFSTCVRRYRGSYRLRRFSCFDQFLCMAFAQLTGRKSLRDIETCLRAMQPKLYHAGFRCRISRSTLADANEHRNWRIYADFAHVLITVARRLYAGDDFGVELDETAYVLDSTTIDLCLSLFGWAHYRRHEAAVKLHTLMDLRGSIPCFVRVSDGKTHDVQILDELAFEPGALYIMDRGYVSFQRLWRLAQSAAYFIIRSRDKVIHRRLSYAPVDRTLGLRSDQVIRLSGGRTKDLYPAPLRRVCFFDVEKRQRFVLLTNHFRLEALTVAQLYRCRWAVELFFKWIKQHLRIEAFFGTSQNAVKTQVWMAISIYVLVAIVKKELKIERSLSEILQILDICLFEKVSMRQVLTAIPLETPEDACRKSLPLFDF